MTIRRFLKDGQVGPQEAQLLELVYRRTLQRLGLADRGEDPMCEALARSIIAVHKRGATDAIAISELAIRELGVPAPADNPGRQNDGGSGRGGR
jgi:hypothetical protein